MAVELTVESKAFIELYHAKLHTAAFNFWENHGERALNSYVFERGLRPQMRLPAEADFLGIGGETDAEPMVSHVYGFWEADPFRLTVKDENGNAVLLNPKTLKARSYDKHFSPGTYYRFSGRDQGRADGIVLADHTAFDVEKLEIEVVRFPHYPLMVTGFYYNGVLAENWHGRRQVERTEKKVSLLLV